MAAETHIHRRVIHTEGHAEGRSRVPVSPFIFISIVQNVCLGKEEGSHAGLSSGLCMSRNSASTLRLTRGWNDVTKFTGERLGGDGGSPVRGGGLEKTGGGGPIVQAPSKGRESVRLSGVVWLCSAVHCGSALRCSGVAMVTSSPTISLGSNRIQISLPLPLL